MKFVHRINYAVTCKKYHAVLLTASVRLSFLALNFIFAPYSCTLMCNFVNVYTIHYCVHTCIPSTKSYCLVTGTCCTWTTGPRLLPNSRMAGSRTHKLNIARTSAQRLNHNTNISQIQNQIRPANWSGSFRSAKLRVIFLTPYTLQEKYLHQPSFSPT